MALPRTEGIPTPGYDAVNDKIKTVDSALGAKDFATETTLAALDNSIKGDDSKTLSDLATLITSLNSKIDILDSVLDSIKDTAGIKKIIDALPVGDNNIGNVDIASAIPVGSNIIGKVGIDQTAGQNLVQLSGSILSQAIIAPVTVNAGATSADSTVLDYHAKYPKQLLLSIAGTFATTSAATGLRLQLFYSPDGVTYDTDAYATIEPTFAVSSAAAQTKQKTRPVMVSAGYYKANVVNLDASVNATTVKVTASEVV